MLFWKGHKIEVYSDIFKINKIIYVNKYKLFG